MNNHMRDEPLHFMGRPICELSFALGLEAGRCVTVGGVLLPVDDKEFLCICIEHMQKAVGKPQNMLWSEYEVKVAAFLRNAIEVILAVPLSELKVKFGYDYDKEDWYASNSTTAQRHTEG